MKNFSYILAALVFGFGSCNNDTKHKDRGSNSIDTVQPISGSNTNESVGSNLDRVPVSTKNLGTFPYLTAPEGYKYSSDHNKRLEEKYFFINDSLVKKVSGQYFHTSIFPSTASFEDTFVVNQYTKDIEALGGVQIYSGNLPKAAGELIDKEKPLYAEDMYDPMPYKYKQFIIKTNTENVWIELCHGLNSNQIDLTVMLEKQVK